MLIEFEGALCRVLEVQHITPGNLRAHVRCRMRDIRNARLLDHKFRAEDDVQRATLDEHEMQFLYREGDLFHFMNTASYEQIHIGLDVLGDNAFYLLPDATINVEFYGEEPVGIHLPVTVDLKVADTVPGIKGATASAQIKPATLETGLVVNVPSFIDTGEKVRVSTETGEYLGRA
ncbi:MAG: elongation factor P [Acidobacteria bacterium]|nr:elongation factor P [Acidobacteriota bacterium]